MKKWLKGSSRQSLETSTRSRLNMDEDDDVTPTNTPHGSRENISLASSHTTVVARHSSRENMPLALSQMTLVDPRRIFSRDIEFIVIQLKCSTCTADLVPPIQMCEKGHSLCRLCTSYMTYCMLCLERITPIRNLLLEELSKWARYMCPSTGIGCRARVPTTMMQEHTRNCLYHEMKCPVNRSISTCIWRGLKMNLQSHISLQHAREMYFANFFTSTTINNESRVIFFNDELFVFHKFFCGTDWFCIVESAGLTRKKYSSTFELIGTNKVDHIVLTVPVHVLGETLGNMYKEAKALRLPGIMLKYFIIGGVMEMEVRIKDITARTNP